MHKSSARVLFACWGLGGGGAERTLTHLFRQNWPAHLEPGLISMTDVNTQELAPPIHTSLVGVGPSIIKLQVLLKGLEKTYGLNDSSSMDLLAVDLGYVPQMIQALRLKGSEYPVIAVSGLFDVLPALLIARTLLGARFPVVAIEQVNPVNFLNHEVDYSVVNKRRMRDLISMSYPLADRVVGVSRAICNLIMERFSIPSHRVKYISNPVSVSDWKSGRLARDPLRVVAMGRLHPVKRYELLLRAMAVIASTLPEVRLTLIGEGEEKENLAALARWLGISHLVEFAGYENNPRERLASASVFAHTSHTEAMPLVMLEAQASGLPIVTTSWSGVEEIVTSGVNGFIVSDDEDSIAEAILSILTDPALQKSLSQRAYDSAWRFDLGTVVWPAYQSLFESLEASPVNHAAANEPPAQSIEEWWRNAREPITLVAPSSELPDLGSWLAGRNLTEKRIEMRARECFVLPKSGDVLVSTYKWPEIAEPILRRGIKDEITRISIMSYGILEP